MTLDCKTLKSKTTGIDIPTNMQDLSMSENEAIENIKKNLKNQLNIDY